MNINNIRIVGTTEFKTNLALGVNPELSTLVTILNKALNDISPQNKQGIFEKWGKHKFVTKIDYSLIGLIVVIFLFVILLIVIWNRKLRDEVTLRREAQAQTNVLLSNIPQQVLVTAQDGTIIKVNNKAKRDYGITDSDLNNINITKFYQNPSDRAKFQHQIKQHGKVEQMIIPWRQANGSIHSMMLSVTPIKYKRKPVFLTIAVDMTDRIEIE